MKSKILSITQVFAPLLLTAAISQASVIVTFDASYGNKAANSAGDLTWSHTVASNSDRILMVAVTFEDTGAAYKTPTAVTFGFQSFTQVTVAPGDLTSLNQVSLWYLVNPTVLTDSITISGLTLNSTGNNVMGTSMSFFGASGIGSSQIFTTGSTASSLAFTGLADGSAIFGAANFSGATTVPASTTLTLPGSLATAGAPGGLSGGAQFNTGQSAHGAGYKLDADITSQSVGFTSTSTRNPFAAVVITPAAIPEPTTVLLGSLGALALLRRRRA